MTLQQLIKQQKQEFKKAFPNLVSFTSPKTVREIKVFMNEVRQESIEYAVNKMIGKQKRANWKDSSESHKKEGYNLRVHEEKQIRDEILKNL